MNLNFYILEGKTMVYCWFHTIVVFSIHNRDKEWVDTLTKTFGYKKHKAINYKYHPITVVSSYLQFCFLQFQWFENIK